jgi:mannose-1-phosphate guanylyltransferase
LLKLCQAQSILQQTVARLRPLIPDERIIIITTGEQVEQLSQQLPQIPRNNILVEPQGRNTAAAIALAAFYLQQKNPQAIMAVLPADHLIKKAEVFRSLLNSAAQLAAREDYLVTLGIKPDRPHTGYGYIVCGERLGSCYRVKSFVEKPSLEEAERLLAASGALWNSGMFVWRVETILAALQQHLPNLYQQLAALKGDWSPQSLAGIYPHLPAVSIDYAVMEKASQVVVFPADLGWNDLGSWASLGELFPADEQGNISPGRLLALDSHGLTVYSPHKLVASLGVEDLIIVDTGDVLLLCAKERAQEVKKLVELVEEKGWREYL